MGARPNNAQVLDRAERSSRGVRLIAVYLDGSPIERLFKPSAPPDAGNPGAVVIRLPAFAVEVGASHASEVRSCPGGNPLGVQSPDGESAFVFRGAPPRLMREGAQFVARVPLP